MKIAICDDERVQLEWLTSACSQWAKHNREVCQIECFESAEAFLFQYEDQKDYDVVLLDIQMQEMSGMDLAKRLRAIGEEVMIIFITGDKRYVFEGYEVQALDYLVKPVKEEKLFQVLGLAKIMCKKEEEILWVESGGMSYKVKQSEIYSIESVGHETIIHMRDQDLMCKKGISELEKAINQQIFYRCHRSYLVNLSNIQAISKKEVVVESGKCMPIARGKWEGLNKAYLDFYRGVICPSF